jgi:hypothetical protein
MSTSYSLSKRFFPSRNKTLKKYTICDNSQKVMDPSLAKTMFDDIYRSNEYTDFSDKNPLYKDIITIEKFNDIMKQIKLITNFTKQLKETKISKLPELVTNIQNSIKKVDFSIKRCPSIDMFDPFLEEEEEESNKPSHHTVGLIHIDEPIIDDVIKTNGKAYYDWIVASNTLASLIEYKAKYKQMNKGGKSKKSRKSRK